jgi:lysozyme
MAASPKRKAFGAACAALVVCTVGSHEGVRYRVYRDIVGVPTYCYGETKNPQFGHVYTPEECKSIFIPRLEEFNAGVSDCVHVALSDKRRAASVSLAYNIGVGAFCKSTFVRRLNAGDPNACDSILAFNRAGGKVVAGLDRRRHDEHKLCKEAA